MPLIIFGAQSVPYAAHAQAVYTVIAVNEGIATDVMQQLDEVTMNR